MVNLNTLGEMRLLANLNRDELQSVAKVVKTRRCLKGKKVLSEGGRGGSIYLVKSGLLKVSHVIRGRQRELGTFKTGDHFGEVSFIDKKPRSASIYALENSELLVFTRKSLEGLQHESPRLQLKLMQALLEDLAAKLRERKFSLDFELSDLLPVNVFEVDHNGIITFANRNGLDSFGYGQKDFDRGLSVFDLLVPEDAIRAKKEINKTLKKGRPRVLEYTAVTQKGEKLPILFHIDPLFRNQKITGFRATLVNVAEQKKTEQALRESQEELKKAHDGLEIRVQERTSELRKTNMILNEQMEERKRAERALRTSEERYRAIMEQSSEGISLIDPQTLRILEANKALQTLLRYSDTEIRTKTFYDIVALPRDVIDASIRQIMEGRLHFISALDFRQKNNSLIKAEVRMDLVAFGGKIAFCSIVRDISERMRAVDEKHKLEENLRKAQMMETMGRLVSGVAHEVRNPLNAIQATTEALYQDLEGNPAYQPYLEIINSQVKRLAELMRDLLELGRPVDQSRMQQESLQQLCTSALQLWRQTSSQFPHRVEFVASEETPISVYVDGARIQQVLLNLLDNAAQHSTEDQAIRLELFRKDSKIVIRVVDKGLGVAPENMLRLFEPFFTTRRGGIGLGLSLVKHIVEIHGGQVFLYNNIPAPGFTVEILLKEADEELSE